MEEKNIIRTIYKNTFNNVPEFSVINTKYLNNNLIAIIARG
jgi:hypothetical protein